MKKTIKTSIIVLLAFCACSTIFAQMPARRGSGAPQQKGDVMAVTIDSIESDMGYIMVTVMTEGFEPFDYQMRPSKHGKVTFEMHKPSGEQPFSIMSFEDANLNHRLDLNEHGVPCEKSAVKHFRGDETEVTVTLRHYDRLIKPSAESK